MVGFSRLFNLSELNENESFIRKRKLGAYLILLYVGVDLFFVVMNFFNEEGEPLSLFIGFLISFFCLLLLVKWNKTELAIIIHILRCNAVAFYFSYIDENPLLTGPYFYFIPASLSALAFYGYSERWKGIGFTLLSYALFLIAIFNPADFHPNEAHFYLVISFSIVLLICVLIILFFDRMMTRSELNLKRKNEELLKANQELDRFVYSASHDLRSPLASIAGLLELSKRDPAAKEEYQEYMYSMVQMMDKFIHDIITYSRNSRLPTKNEVINLHELCQQAIEHVKYTDITKRPKYSLQIDKDLVIVSDAARLKVVLNNLLNNAIKYSDPAKDELNITISATKTPDAVIFSVEDNGIGIAEEHQAKIFDMFYRASEQAVGSGLGLYIVKESLDKIGGSVALKSQPQKGTVFTITIPQV